MKRRLGAAAALSVLHLTTAAAGETPIVLTIHAESMDWPAARHSVEAELRASGFAVVSQESAARDPGTLLAELAQRTANHAGAVGSVTVLRVGDTGFAYVWLPRYERLFRVDTPAADTEVAAGMLSLRVVDLFTIQPATAEAPDESTPPAAQPASPTRNHDAAVWAWLGTGIFSGSIGDRPGGQLTMGLTIPLSGPIHLDLGAAAVALPSRTSLPAGAVTSHHQQLAVHLLADALRRDTWSVVVGAGGGGACLQAQGQSSEAFVGTADRACTLTVSARLRVAWHVGRLRTWAAWEPGILLPGMRLVVDEHPATNLGRPWWAANLGVGWAL